MRGKKREKKEEKKEEKKNSERDFRCFFCTEKKIRKNVVWSPPHNGKIFGRRPKILVKNDKKMVHFFSIFKKFRLRRAKNRDFSQKISPAAG